MDVSARYACMRWETWWLDLRDRNRFLFCVLASLPLPILIVPLLVLATVGLDWSALVAVVVMVVMGTFFALRAERRQGPTFATELPVDDKQRVRQLVRAGEGGDDADEAAQVLHHAEFLLGRRERPTPRGLIGVIVLVVVTGALMIFMLLSNDALAAAIYWAVFLVVALVAEILSWPSKTRRAQATRDAADNAKRILTATQQERAKDRPPGSIHWPD